MISFRRTGKSQPETAQFIPFVFSLKAIVFKCLPTQGAQMVKNLPAMQETWVGPWVGKIPGGKNGNPLQSSCLENPVDRGAWQAIHGVTKELGTTERLT